SFRRCSQVHSCAARLRKADRDRLLGGARAMLALANMVHLLSHEFARLGGRGLSVALVLVGALDGLLVRHVSVPPFSSGVDGRTSRHIARSRASCLTSRTTSCHIHSSGALTS